MEVNSIYSLGSVLLFWLLGCLFVCLFVGLLASWFVGLSWPSFTSKVLNVITELLLLLVRVVVVVVCRLIKQHLEFDEGKVKAMNISIAIAIAIGRAAT